MITAVFISNNAIRLNLAMSTSTNNNTQLLHKTMTTYIHSVHCVLNV